MSNIVGLFDQLHPEVKPSRKATKEITLVFSPDEVAWFEQWAKDRATQAKVNYQPVPDEVKSMLAKIKAAAK